MIKDEISKQIETDNYYQDNGIIPKCHFCNKEDCYDLEIRKIDGEEVFIRHSFMDEGQFVCKDCHQWMVNSGKFVTVILHFLLKIRIKALKVLKIL